MVSVDCLLFGYRKIKVAAKDISLAASILLRAGISSKIAEEGFLVVRERDFSVITELFFGRVECSASDLCGIPGQYKRIKHKTGIFTGVALSFLLCVILSNMIWDVRVEGNEKIPDSAIVLALSDVGFSVGDFWGGVDRSDVETEFLKNNDDVSWININRRGTVAYVTLSERDEGSSSGAAEEKQSFANVVASESCIIEEITVTSGTAMVKPGDAVKKGDILIAGVLPDESGGEFCFAEGVVRGRVGATVSAEVSREYSYKSVQERKIRNISVKIFDLNINIFKIYGNSSEEYDIIKDVDSFSLLGGAKLPFEIVKEYETPSVQVCASYTDEEIVRVASSRLNLKLLTQLAGADLVKIRTHGSFTDSGYVMYSDIVYSKNVSQTLLFDTDK